MSLQDPIADMLTRIRNACMVSLKTVSMPSSKLKLAICKVLQEEGYIEGYSSDEAAKPTLTIQLKYTDRGKPVIETIQRTSRPGLRTYATQGELPRIKGGLGVAIVTTDRGVMTDRAARRQGIGGEVICTVF